ncbi:MAG: CotH kinase family protein [Oscillospiraceae bacterium]|nr:CotH kinase family protein [Oscillospiraceae bacterium]
MIVYIASVALVAVIVAGVMLVTAGDDVARFHQHLHRPSEAALGACDCGDDDVLCTHLPLMVIDTFGAEIPGRPLAFGSGIYNDPETLFNHHTTPDGEEEIAVLVRVIDNANAWNHAADEAAHESMAMMRLRGNSSRFFDKPNYRIQLLQADGEDNPLPLLGMSAHMEWALHGPFLDKTLMRNYMWMNIAAEVMGPGHFVPEVRFFELILNGEYQGLYVLMETARVAPDRVNLNRHRPAMPTTSYLVQLDSHHRRAPERSMDVFSTHTLRLEYGRSMAIMYPNLRRQTDDVHGYIARSISIAERLLYSPEMIWYTRPYERYMDVDSFVNFFIINEFVGNNDLWANSTFLHKDVRGRLAAGPVWDFNNVMNNYFLEMPAEEFMLADRGWFARLMTCPFFTDRVIRRWHSLRRNVLCEDRLLDYMQQVEDWLGSAIDRNFAVWGHSFDYTQMSAMARRRPTRAQYEQGVSIRDVNPTSFAQAQAWAREYMVTRGRWLDQYIVTLRQFSHTSRHAGVVLQ